jgi:hypothetical protein
MASPAPNGSYLQQADPQTFPANATGASPSTTYQQTAPQQEQQSTEPTPSKDEIGWYFVEQYYTTLNKTPERVHVSSPGVLDAFIEVNALTRVLPSVVLHQEVHLCLGS